MKHPGTAINGSRGKIESRFAPMSRIPNDATAQAVNIDPITAIATARRERFPNLCSDGILERWDIGPPVNPAHVTRALACLGRCRRTNRPNVHTRDLQRHFGVGPGAIIAAGHALGFDVRSWYGVTSFSPHAMIAVNLFDVRKAVRS
jgi:hypothetical protein